MKRTSLHLAELTQLIAKGLALGATRVSKMTFEWGIAGNCEKPYTRELYARPDGYKRPKQPFHWGKEWASAWGEELDPQPQTGPAHTKHVTVTKTSVHSLRLRLETRCRKCGNCRRVRSRLWRQRALTETKLAARTWMATYTLRPNEQERSLWVARERMEKMGIDFDTLDQERQFIERTATIQPAFTKMIKRIRKNYSRAYHRGKGPMVYLPVRYLLVAEAHKSGLPHFHALIHQIDPDRPLLRKFMDDEWPLGFEYYELLKDPAKATYLCKYLTKSAAARVRASQAYGTRELEYQETILNNSPLMQGA